jgi:hypothetical protein
MKLKGDLRVSREIQSDRSMERLTSETLAADRQLDRYDRAWLSLDPDGEDREVALPDAQTVEPGWKVIVKHSGSADALNVRAFNTTPFTGAIQKTIAAPAAPRETTAYQFVCLDNSSEAGEWYVIELGDPAAAPVARFVASFVSGDWPAASAGKRTLTSSQVAGLGVAAHERGATPMYIVQEEDAGSFEKVLLDAEIVDASGNLSLRVTANDAFNGRVILI